MTSGAPFFKSAGEDGPGCEAAKRLPKRESARRRTRRRYDPPHGSWFPGSSQFPGVSSCSCPQVQTSYQWFNAVEMEAASEGKKLLRINCDETNVMRGMKTQKGLVVSCCRRNGPVIVPNSDPTRGSWTHLAFICDDTSIQPSLPQVIVGNEKYSVCKTSEQLKAVCPIMSLWFDRALAG